MEQKRKLRVYTKYSRKSKRFIPNPEIRITGKWVKDWGFNCGTQITVRNIENGILIINDKINHPPTINL